jgi:SAM-dependent methyltransferase
MLGSEFGAGTLEASTGGARIDFSRKGKPTITMDRTARATREPTPLEKPWHTLLDPSAPYLRALGLVRADRQIAAGSGDKLRQIEKFLECFLTVLTQAGLADSKEPIRILDIGSGKSYLTFAMYDVLTRQGNREVSVTGIEQRPELVASSRLLAKEVGFDGLNFIEGKAGETGTSSTETQASTVVVALHACDTATDDAIMLALTMRAKALLVAPCCQKYFRRFLTVPADLQPIYRHPILEEHLAIDLTDGARVLYLESEGYRSKLFEFVSVEHTARNTMITAIRGGVSPQQSDDARKAIFELRTRFDLPDIYLDR